MFCAYTAGGGVRNFPEFPELQTGKTESDADRGKRFDGGTEPGISECHE
jgi:hypothetical protein